VLARGVPSQVLFHGEEDDARESQDFSHFRDMALERGDLIVPSSVLYEVQTYQLKRRKKNQ